MQMKRTIGRLAVFLALTSGGSLLAHHSLVNFDTTTPVRVKGTIVAFQRVNPHSFVYLEEKTADGQVRRWAVEGPTVRQINQIGSAVDVLKPGVEIEVCGYAPKEPIVWPIVSPDRAGVSIAGRLLNAELLVMPDGTVQSWGDYGVHKCFPPGYIDRHSR